MTATALPSTGADGATGADWAPCSDRSAARADPLAGTAGLGRRWLLVEIDGSWGRDAFFDSRLDPAVGRALVGRAESAGVRPVAIRRPARRADERRATRGWRWALADARPGHERIGWGFAARAEDLLAVALNDPDAGEASADPVYLVCAHARHDRCCAVKGRPVAAALAAAHPAETWESSHLGGDRFAATMLVLPHGLSYGRVPPSDVTGVVEASLRGLVVPHLLRGRTAFTMPVQAAQAVARAQFGDDRIDAWMPRGEHRDGDLVRVRLDDPRQAGGEVEVVLREAPSEPLLSTCAATVAAPVRQFVAVEVRRG